VPAIEHNIPSVIRTLQNVQKQVRFATSQAINDTAKEVQQFTIEKQLPDKFTLRSKGAPWQKPGSKLGFNIRPFATKDRLEARLGSQADFLNLQERGGTKRADGHRVAVVVNARPSHRAVIPRALKPRRIMAKSGRAKGFTIKTDHGEGIFIRQNKIDLKLMYWLKPDTRIKARLGFEKAGAEMADQILERNFTRRFASALATAKR
jgi:hypothetical protein